MASARPGDEGLLAGLPGGRAAGDEGLLNGFLGGEAAGDAGVGDLLLSVISEVGGMGSVW